MLLALGSGQFPNAIFRDVMFKARPYARLRIAAINSIRTLAGISIYGASNCLA
jgi:hypothetical protein